MEGMGDNTPYRPPHQATSNALIPIGMGVIVGHKTNFETFQLGRMLDETSTYLTLRLGSTTEEFDQMYWPFLA